MTTDRDFDRIAAAWLADGPEELSSRVLDAVVDEIHLTRQRRVLHAPWRFPAMTTPARVAAAAVIGVLAVGGTVLFLKPGPSSVGGPRPSPAVAASPTPTVIPPGTPAPSPATITGTSFQIPVRLAMPADWTCCIDRSDQFVIWRPKPTDGSAVVGIDLVTVSNVYRDLCDPAAGLLDPPLGPTADALARFLLSAEPLHASSPGQVAIGGFQGTAIDEAMTSTARCRAGLVLWPTTAEPYVVDEGEHKRFVVLDVRGQRVVVVIFAADEAWPQVLDEAQAVLDTISFD